MKAVESTEDVDPKTKMEFLRKEQETIKAERAAAKKAAEEKKREAELAKRAAEEKRKESKELARKAAAQLKESGKLDELIDKAKVIRTSAAAAEEERECLIFLNLISNQFT